MSGSARLARPLATITLLATLAAGAFALSACNTVAGAGQDVSSAGHDVSNGAVAAKRSIQNGQ